MRQFISLIIFALSFATFARASDFFTCKSFMVSLAERGDSTATYIALVRNLALEKSAFTAESLRQLLSEPDMADPLAYVSRDMTASERYAFSKAFTSLRDVDWESAKESLRSLEGALKDNKDLKGEAELKTAPIYAAVDFADVTSKLQISADLIFIPKRRAPIFTTFHNGKVVFVDLGTQTLREHNLISLGNEAYVQLADGRVFIAYASRKGSRITIEDFDSGVIIDSVDLGEGFLKSEASLGRSHLSLFQKADGTLKLIVPHTHGLRLVYDFGIKRGYSLQSVNQEVIHNHSIEDGQGEVYDFTTKRMADDKYKFSLYRLQNGGPEVVIGGLELPSLGNYFGHQIVILKDGRFAMTLDGEGKLAILNPGAKKFNAFIFKSKDYDTVEPVEWPPGELRVLAQRTRRGKRKITLIDQKRKVLSWVLPSSENEVVLFNPLSLKDGREIYVVEHFNQGVISRISFLDLVQTRVLSISLSARSITQFDCFYESADGRILGLYNDNNGRVRTLQLYGPITAGANAR